MTEPPHSDAPPRRATHLHRSLLVSLAGLVLACAPAINSRGGEAVLVERLYFGRNASDSLVVTDSAWMSFVAEVVTPRFPSGLTSWSAMGQWRGADGRIRREPSFVLELVNPAGAPDTEAAIAAIIAEYKRRFRQEAVLRVVTAAHAMPE